jgi:hypothetical protein
MIDILKAELKELESLHESEITPMQQERLNELARELELEELFDLYNA